MERKMKEKKKKARLKKRQADYDAMKAKPSNDNWAGFKRPGSYNN